MDGPVVILGASGLLGQALVHEAARRGLPAVAVSRRSGADLAAPDAVARHVLPLRPSLVINAAAITDLARCEADPRAALALHANLPEQLARACSDRALPWVQLSTDHYFSGASNELHDEDAPVQLRNEYARTKFIGEALAATSPLALIVRTNLVGRRRWPGQPTFAEWVVAALQQGQPFDAYSDVWASSIEAGQLAPLLFELVDLGARGLLNVAASESVSKAQFITAVASALGLPIDAMRVVPRPATTQPPRANALGLDVRRAEQLLGRRLPDHRAVAHALALAFEERMNVPA